MPIRDHGGKTPEIKMDLPVAPDEETVQAVRPPEMVLEIPVAPDEETVQAVRPPEMVLEIPVAADEETVQAVKPPEMVLEIPVAADEETVQAVKPPEMVLEIPVAADEETVQAVKPPEMVLEIPVAADEETVQAVRPPEMVLEIPVAADEETVQVIKPLPEMVLEIPVAADEETVQAVRPPEMVLEIPVAADEETVQVIKPLPEMVLEIPVAADEETVQAVRPPEMVLEIPVAPDEETVQAVKPPEMVLEIPVAADEETVQAVKPPEMVLEIPVAPDEETVQAVRPPEMVLEIPVAADEETVQVIKPLPEMVLEIPVAADEETVQAVRPPEMVLEIPVAPDEETVQAVRPPEMVLEIPVAPDEETVQAVRPPEMVLEIPVAPDEETVQAVRPPEMVLEIPVAPDEESVQAVRPPEMVLEIPVAADEEVKRIQHSFSEGFWLPGADPLMIGAANFSDIQNLRPGDRCIEGVPGYSKINTTALATYLKIRSCIQLQAPFTTKSRIIAQAWDSDLTESALIQNVTAVPSQGDFAGSGVELVVNGTGWTGVLGTTPPDMWTELISASLSLLDDGLCMAYNFTGSYPAIYQTVNVEIGRLYQLSFDAYCLFATFPYRVNVGTTPGDNDVYSTTGLNTSVETTTTTFTPSTSVIYITLIHVALAGSSGNYSWFDNVSLQLQQLHIDADGAALGRFFKWPGNQIAYCNEKETLIWGGDEMPVAAFFTCSQPVALDGSVQNEHDYTDRMSNDMQTSTDTAIVGDVAIDDDTILLAHFDAASPLADSSSAGHTLSLSGSAAVSTTQNKYGGSALYLPGGATDYALIADAADLDFGSDDFTIEWWEYRTAAVGYASAISRDLTHFTPWTLGHDNGSMLFYASSNGTSWDIAWGHSFGTTIYNAWTHYRVVRESGTFYLFQNGKRSSQPPWNPGLAFLACAASAIIGKYYTNNTFHGYIDELRISNVSRGTSDFTPATHAFGAGEHTFLIGCTRPAQAHRFYLADGGENTQTSHITAKEWNGEEWSYLDTTDGTNTSAAPLLFSDDFSSTDSWTASSATLTIDSDGETGSCLSVAESGGANPGKAYHDITGLSAGVYSISYALKKGTSATGKVMVGTDADEDKYFTSSAHSDADWVHYSTTVTVEAGVTVRITLQTDDATAGEDSLFDNLRFAQGVVFSAAGSISFTSTVDSSKPRRLLGMVLYWYQYTFFGGSATLYRVTVDMPMQPLLDIWDGTEIVLPSILRYKAADATYYDITAVLADNSESTYEEIGGLVTATEWLLIGSLVPLMGVNIRLVGGKANKVASTTLQLAICDGTELAAWPQASALVDGTSNSDISLNQSGVVTWMPGDPEKEFTTSFAGGPQMYFYKASFTETLTASDVQVYYITGIPAPMQIKPYKFPFMFLSRPMLCGYVSGNEGNRVDYGMVDSSDVWNGPDSSNGLENRPLYFGGSEELTAACEVYNRLGSSIYSFAIFTKNYETYILNGYDSATYRIYPISQVIGCPAPLTMDTWQLGVSKDQQSVRSIAMWMSHAGPVLFDSGGLMLVPGLECYFDKRDARCINSAAIENARGGFDPDTGHYHLMFPSGSAQTTNNVWVALDVNAGKWYKVVPSAATSPYPSALVRVSDLDGRQYVYGARDNGYLMRLHDPDTAAWDGTSSVQSVTLGDMMCTNDIWDNVRLVRLKLFGVSVDADDSITILHYADGAVSSTSLFSVRAYGSNRYFKNTQLLNVAAAWSHCIKFSKTVPTGEDRLKLLGWGLEYQVERDDHGSAPVEPYGA